MPEIADKHIRRTRLSVDLKDLHADWTAWCTQHRLVPSDAIRRILRRVLQGRPVSDALPHPSDFECETGDGRRRVEIRLSSAEHAALTAAADREGMSVPRWLGSLVRLHLTDEQQFGSEEVEALARSSQVLLALGRNINQIARNMNPHTDNNTLTLAQIEYLSGLIKTHTETVSTVLHANSRRWRR